MTDLQKKVCQWIRRNNAIGYAFRPLNELAKFLAGFHEEKINTASVLKFLEMRKNRYDARQIEAILNFAREETGEEIDYRIDREEDASKKNPIVPLEQNIQHDKPSSVPDNFKNPFIKAAFNFIEGILNRNTRNAYRHTLIDFFRLFRDPSAVGPEHIILYRKYCEERKNSIATIERKLAALNSFFDFLKKNGLVQKNPVDIKRARIDPYCRAKKINKEMYAKICTVIDQNSAIGARDYAILLFCFYTGRRIGEILALKKNDFIFKDGRNFYRYMIEKKRTPKLKIRVIPKKVMDAIEKYWIISKYYPVNDNPIFISYSPQNQGEPLSYGAFYRAFRKYCNLAGFDDEIDLHSLRHLRTELLEEKGVSIKQLSDELDHEQLNQTLIYMKALSDREDDDDQKYKLLDE